MASCEKVKKKRKRNPLAENSIDARASMRMNDSKCYLQGQRAKSTPSFICTKRGYFDDHV